MSIEVYGLRTALEMAMDASIRLTEKEAQNDKA